MKRSLLFVSIVVLLVLLSACAAISVTPVPPSDPSVASSKCVKPESDNQNSWNYSSCVDVSTTVFKLTIVVEDEITNHTEVGASGSAIYYYGVGTASYRLWQEGKGLLPVRVLSIEPSYEQVPAGSNIVLKTTDLKAMGLPTGATTIFICNLDTEVLSPVQSMQVLTEDRLTYEFDDCRMFLPTYIPAPK